MTHNPKHNPSGPPAESDPLDRLILRLLEAGSELQAYQSIQTEHSDSQNDHSDLLQKASTNLRVAVDSLAHLNSTLKAGSNSSFNRDASMDGRAEQEWGFPSVDYLRSLRKRAEQTQVGKRTDIETLTKEEIQHAIHELEVHQVELKMQNEELLRVQMELETSRDRFSNLFELAPVGYCILDRHGRVLETNNTLCQLLGVSRNELIQTPIQQYIEEEDQDSFYLYQKLVQRNEARPITEIRMVKKGGEHFFAQLESRIVHDQGGQHWLVVSDISSLKRAEEIASRHAALTAAHADLEIEKNRFQDLFDFAPDGYFVTDETGMILNVNRGGAALLFTAKEALVHAPLVDFIIEEEKECFQCRVKEILEKKTADANPRFGEWEVHLKPVGREPYPAAITAVLLQEKSAGQLQIRWLVRDITLRKQTEAELGKNTAQFRALFEESSLGIRLLDLQGNTMASNAAMQEILGYAEDELRQIPLAQLTDQLDRAQDEYLFRSIVSGEIDRYILEERCIRKDGQQVWVHQVVFMVRDVVKLPSFLVIMTENISERKEMERELVEVKRLLIDAPEAERLMLSQELHDGPMQDLYGVFYQLKSLEGKLTGKDVEIVSSCSDTINHVVHLLRGFAGQLRPPTLNSFGLEKTIRSHSEQFQQDHPEIILSLELMPDGKKLPERVSLALFRIYQQSLANILRHSHATCVDVRLTLDVEHVQLEIEDNGEGFEAPSRLVDLIQQGHFGLVSAAERAEAIGGTLTIDSKPGQGTKIRVTVNKVMMTP